MRRNAALVIASVTLCVAAIELVLRLAGLSYPILHRLEAERGWGPWPGIDGVYRAEGLARVRFNSAGARGPEIAADKSPEMFRIAVLGDSMTEAREVAEDATFVAHMAAALATCTALGGRRVEAINFGVSGYGTGQQYLTLTSTVLGYRPDLVLLAFFPGNDVWNNLRDLDGHNDRPYFVLARQGLRLDRSSLDTSRFRTKMVTRNAMNSLINHSYFLQVTRDAIGRLKQGRRGGAVMQPQFLAGNRADEVLQRRDDDAWRTAWTVTERLLLAMQGAVAEAGGRFAVGVLSVPAQIYPDSRARAGVVARLDIDTLFNPNDRLAEFGRANRLAVFSVAEPMHALADRDGDYYHGFANGVLGDGHYNEAGHRVAGALMAEGVCETLSAPLRE